MYKLAFIGPQGSGKTAMAKACVAHANKFPEANFACRISFADALRSEVMALLKYAGIFAEWEKPEILMDPLYKARYRPLLQVWGTEIRRSVAPNYWVDKALATINSVTKEWQYPIIAIDDCRFQNEYDALKAVGFTFIRLDPNPEVTPYNPEHASEADWPLFPCDNTLSWLDTEEQRIDQLLWEILC